MVWIPVWKWVHLLKANLEILSYWIRKDTFTKPTAGTELVEKSTGFVGNMKNRAKQESNLVRDVLPGQLQTEFMSKIGRVLITIPQLQKLTCKITALEKLGHTILNTNLVPTNPDQIGCNKSL